MLNYIYYLTLAAVYGVVSLNTSNVTSLEVFEGDLKTNEQTATNCIFFVYAQAYLSIHPSICRSVYSSVYLWSV